MYLSYADFKVLFKKIELTESDFTTLEGFAEGIVNSYTGVMLSETGKEVGEATGLIIQRMIAVGYRPQDLPASYSEGGIATTYKDIELIPQNAKRLLDKYRRTDF